MAMKSQGKSCCISKTNVPIWTFEQGRLVRTKGYVRSRDDFIVDMQAQSNPSQIVHAWTTLARCYLRYAFTCLSHLQIRLRPSSHLSLARIHMVSSHPAYQISTESLHCEPSYSSVPLTVIVDDRSWPSSVNHFFNPLKLDLKTLRNPP